MNIKRAIPFLLLLTVIGVLIQHTDAFAQSKIQRVCSGDSVVCIIAEEFESDSVIFLVENLTTCDVTVTLELTLENMICSEDIPYTQAYTPRSIHRAFKIEVKNREAADWKYGSDYYYLIGNFRAVHDSSYIYHLPYLHGKKYRVIQGYNGDFTHTGKGAYALDFDMPSGTEVCACREGTVVVTEDVFERGADDIDLADSANYVMICHDDGTIGRYLHLLENSVRVSAGQKVSAGQIIGLSGNTGYSRGEHLHFEVFRPIDGKQRISIPVRFNTVEGKGIILQKDSLYTAP